MDKELPDNFDPYASGADRAPQPFRGVNDHGNRPQENDDYDSPDNGFFPDSHEVLPVKDARVTLLLQWCGGVAASLVTVGIVWIASISVSTARKVDVLLDRPQPIPVYQYETDMRVLKDDVAATKLRITSIENRQLESIRVGRINE